MSYNLNIALADEWADIPFAQPRETPPMSPVVLRTRVSYGSSLDIDSQPLANNPGTHSVDDPVPLPLEEPRAAVSFFPGPASSDGIRLPVPGSFEAGTSCHENSVRTAITSNCIFFLVGGRPASPLPHPDNAPHHPVIIDLTSSFESAASESSSSTSSAAAANISKPRVQPAAAPKIDKGKGVAGAAARISKATSKDWPASAAAKLAKTSATMAAKTARIAAAALHQINEEAKQKDAEEARQRDAAAQKKKTERGAQIAQAAEAAEAVEVAEVANLRASVARLRRDKRRLEGQVDTLQGQLQRVEKQRDRAMREAARLRRAVRRLKGDEASEDDDQKDAEIPVCEEGNSDGDSDDNGEVYVPVFSQAIGQRRAMAAKH